MKEQLFRERSLNKKEKRKKNLENDHINYLEASIEELEKKNENLEREHTINLKKLQLQEKETQELIEQDLKQKQVIQRLNSELNLLRSGNFGQRKDTCNLNEKLNNIFEDNTQQNIEQIHKINSDLDENKKEVITLYTKNIKQSATTMRNVSSEKSYSNSLSDELINKTEGRKSDFEKMSEEYKKLQINYRELQKSYLQMNEDCDKIQQQYNYILQLEEHLKQKDQDIWQLNVEMNRLAEINKTLEVENTQFKDAIFENNENVLSLKETHKEELKEMQDEYDKVNLENTLYQNQIENMKKKNEELKKDNEEKEIELKNVKKELENSEKEQRKIKMKQEEDRKSVV